ncbi:MAG TPA: carboxypeptidase-like regulatory domain-containing protein [Armatimonadota bacterium]|jgi:hypothetical protein
MKALLALMGLLLALVLISGCNDSNNNKVTVQGSVVDAGGAAVNGADVTLLNPNGTTFRTVNTGLSNTFRFTNVPKASGYTISVSSAAGTAITPVNVTGNTVVPPITVTPASATASVSGTIGTTNPTATYTVNIVKGTTTVATTTAGPAAIPTFTLNNVPVDTGYIIEVIDNNNIATDFGPVTVPSGGIPAGTIDIIVKTSAELTSDGVPVGPNVVAAYTATSGTLSIDGGAPSGSANPAFLTGIAVGSHTATLTPDTGTPVTVNFIVRAGDTTVIRANDLP